MRKQAISIALSGMLLLAIGVSHKANAVTADRDDAVATAKVSSSEITWEPTAQHSAITLTVLTPDGEVIRKEFASGASPSLRAVDEKGVRLADGQYTYELRVTPIFAPGVRETLAAARANGTDAEVTRDLRRRGVLPRETPVQSGAFSIIGGVFVMGGETEGSGKVGSTVAPSAEPTVASPVNRFRSFGSALRPASQTTKSSARALTQVSARGMGVASRYGVLTAARLFDQVIPDDLIVQGSLCVGFDCVNNESFGTDTIRLKENNLRIKFEDTSVGTFPSTDWQLTANDQASGGANRFSIEDITSARVPFTIAGAAPTNSMFVSSTGRVGFRTATPGLDLHITTSDTPAHRFEQTNASGFAAQTWDIGANEANFFVRDLTGGSRLPFRIRPGAPTSSLDIAATGFVGIGTGSPTSQLHLSDISTTANILQTFQNGTRIWTVGINGATDIFRITDNTVVAPRFVITNTGNIGIGGLTTPTNPLEHMNGAKLTAGGVWMDASSRALKTDIRRLSSNDALKALEKLNPVQFEYKAQPGEKYVGFIAEDVPDLVASGDRKSLSSMDVVAVLTKVVQEQQKTIAELKDKVLRLETRKATAVRRKAKRQR